MDIEPRSAGTGPGDARIAVVGGGLAGLAVALGVARTGRRVLLFDGDEAREDARTTAMLRPTIDMLRGWGVWADIEPESAPLRVMRIIDGSRRLVRAPTVSFSAQEIGEDAFGWNVPNAAAAQALRRAIDDEPTIERIPARVDAIDLTADRARLVFGDDEWVVPLVVGADGGRSIVRRSANIGVWERAYPQTAIVTTFTHELPHGDVSTEFHTEHGPATQVPLPGDRSSLVWVTAPAEAQELAALAPERLSERIEDRLAHLLGRVTVDGAVGQFPMRTLRASAYAGQRAALVGEAVHAFPPIGAQGFNLTMRDVRTLIELQRDAADPGAAPLLDAYDRERSRDAATRSLAVDVANRTLLDDGLAAQIGKAMGLGALRSIPQLREVVMREGFQPNLLRRRTGSDVLSGALRRLREADARFRAARG